MPTNRIIYNVQDLYVGPANDSLAITLPGSHLLQRLYRIQSFDYSVSLNRSTYNEVGKRGSLINTLIDSPDVNFEFDYYQFSVSNESKIGLNANWNLSGQSAIYGSGACIISGFSQDSRLFDKRNYYVTINKSGLDGHASYIPRFATGASGYSLETFVDPFSHQYEVISFVNSYLTRLSYEGSVGDLPRCQVACVADNAVYFLSGSGAHVPALQETRRSGVFSDKKFVVPKHYKEIVPSALKPGDITFFLSGRNYDNTMRDIGMVFHDAKVQSYSINMDINREKIKYLGAKHVCDRPIQYPVFVDFSVEAIVGDLVQGSAELVSSVYGPTHLKATDGNYYAFRLNFDGVDYIFDIDQFSSAPSYATEDYWVITCDDALNYKVYLDIDTNGEVVFLVEQTSTLEPGAAFKSVYATDNTHHKVTLITEFGYIILQVENVPSTPPSATTTGFGGGGSVAGLKYLDTYYDASVSVRNSLANPFAGQHTAVRFDLKNLKLESISYSSDIESKKTANLTFRTEIDTEDINRGLFISGILSNITVGGTVTLNPNYSSIGDGDAGVIQEGGTVVDNISIVHELITHDTEIIVDHLGEPIKADDIIYTPSVF